MKQLSPELCRSRCSPSDVSERASCGGSAREHEYIWRYDTFTTRPSFQMAMIRQRRIRPSWFLVAARKQ